jgi:O-antigen/teichoic acid export membrane protein
MDRAAWIVARHGVGLFLALAGAAALAWILGPAAYGRWAAAAGVAAWAQGVGAWGAPVWALTQDPRPAFGFTVLASAALGALALGAAPWAPIGAAALGGAALGLLTAVPSATLERAGRWRAQAAVELAGQVVQVGLAVGLALAGYGLAAPIAGWWAGGAVLLGLLALLGAVPRPAFAGLRSVAAGGAAWTGTMQLWTARELVPAFVIAPLAGPEAVAAVAVARRVVDAGSFAKGALWRVALARLSAARADPIALREALAAADRMGLASVAPLAAVALAAPLIGWMGPGWEAAIPLVPLVAFTTAANAVFAPRCAALVAVGRIRELALFHAVHVGILGVAAAALAPRFGALAWGGAEIAALAAYPMVAASAARALAR